MENDLRSEVGKILVEPWTRRDGAVVPTSVDVGLGNDAVVLNAAVLYADIRGSTSIVDSCPNEFAAAVYKTFLHCAAKIISKESGAVTAYDGDRIMAVWLGPSRCRQAVRAAMKLNYARANIVLPGIRARHPAMASFNFVHTAGIDASELLVARTGIRGANDLVWVGRSANHAAKMCELDTYRTWITLEAYQLLSDNERFDANRAHMWVDNGSKIGSRSVYGSNCFLAP